MRILYILGSTRSGTSALRNAIARTRFAGYGEGHMAPFLHDLFDRLEFHRTQGLGADVKGTGLSHVRRDVLLRHLVHGYERYLVGELKSEDVLDKTPTVDPIRLAPQLNRYHEAPLFVFCARRHVDNVLSKMRKFPDTNFEKACREWAGCNETWLNVRQQLDGNALELEHRQLATEPESVAHKLADYLVLDAPETATLASQLAHGRPEQTSDRDISDFTAIGDTGWTRAQQNMIRQICGPVGARLGYGFETFSA